MRYLIMICFGLLPLLNLAQLPPAFQHILDLKEGSLLVRLRTGEKTIKAYEEKKNLTRADVIRRKYRIENEATIKAFQKEFTFCPVYFLFTNASEAVKAGDPKGIFLNDSLEVDPSISRTGDFFFTAEFANHPSAGFNGLFVKDPTFSEMPNPFPDFERTFRSVGVLEKSKTETVKQLNASLINFYERALKKQDKLERYGAGRYEPEDE